MVDMLGFTSGPSPKATSDESTRSPQRGIHRPACLPITFDATPGPSSACAASARP